MDERRVKDLHLLDYWRVLVKRRFIVYTALAVTVTTVLLGSLLQRPIYTATTRLQIEQNSPKVMPFQEVVSSVPDGRNDFYQTQYGLIQSRRVAGEVIASLGLAGHEEFRVRPGGARPGLTAERIDETRRTDLFLKRLKVVPVRNSRLVDVSFPARDPVLAATIANRVAETYIAFNTEVQYNTTARATTSLVHQIANLQEAIDAKEKELQAYAREHGIVSLGDKQNIALKNLNDLSDAWTRARAARIEKEARYAALRSGGPGELHEVLESALIKELTAKRAELTRRQAQLSQKYKADWPEMVRLRREIDDNGARLQSERDAIYQQALGVAEHAFRAARNEESRLKEALDAQKRTTQEFSLKEIRWNNLKAEIANKRSTIEALLKRQAETSTSAAGDDLAVSNVRVVDVAEIPTRKSSPRVLQNLIVSLLAGLALGVGLAFFFEYLDKSVKSPEELVHAAGIPSIGVVPALAAEGGGLRVIKPHGRAAAASGATVEMVSQQEPKSKVSEAFREVRTALLVSQPGRPPRSILITSAQPGDGKTAVAVNLATTLAQIGRRVLLVDGDLRKPRLHRIFAVDNEQGLSSCLSGAGPLWPEPKGTGIPGLDVVTSGPLPPNPADLFDSERFEALQREFEARGYDHVIYDSPPVLAVADPTIVAGRVEAVVMVVRAGITSRDAVAHAVDRLRQVQARVVGGVLNVVQSDGPGSYYAYAYRRYYGEEGAAAEEGSPRPRSKRGAQPRV